MVTIRKIFGKSLIALFLISTSLLMLTSCDLLTVIEPTLTLSPQTIELNSAGEKQTITITTNQKEWSFTQEGDWFTVVKEGNTLNITASANTTLTPKTGGKITVRAGALKDNTNGKESNSNINYKEESVTITQLGAAVSAASFVGKWKVDNNIYLFTADLKCTLYVPIPEMNGFVVKEAGTYAYNEGTKTVVITLPSGVTNMVVTSYTVESIITTVNGKAVVLNKHAGEITILDTFLVGGVSYPVDYTAALAYCTGKGGGVILHIASIAGVSQGNPKGYPEFTLKKATHIELIFTYHWNWEYGAKKNVVAYINDKSTGTRVLECAQLPYPGQGGKVNANWSGYPRGKVLQAGTYVVRSSDEATWSYAYDTIDVGMTTILGW